MLSEALTAIVHRLEEAKAAGLLRNYGLVAGLAVSVWSVPRATSDIDFIVALGSTQPSALTSFVGGEYRAGSADDPLQGVFSGNVALPGRSVPFQLVQLPSRWMELTLSHVETLSIMDCAVPVVSWKPMLLLKLYAGGPRDLLDAQEIFKARAPKAEDISDMKAMAESVGLSEEFEAFLFRACRAS